MTQLSRLPSGAPRSNALPARLARRALWAAVQLGCHADLERLPEETIRAELEGGRQWLEAIVGRPVDLLAWPFGRATEPMIRIARELGFRHQLLGDPWPQGAGEPDLHGRLIVNPCVSWRVGAWAVLRGRW